MAETKGTRRKRTTSTAKAKPQATEKPANKQESTSEEEIQFLATGLEDYGRWKAIYKDHQRAKDEPPFRRGRIWC